MLSVAYTLLKTFASCTARRPPTFTTLTMAFSFEHAMKVSADHLKPAVYIPVQKVGGKSYFILSKTNGPITRMLGCGRGIGRTAIIDTITIACQKATMDRVAEIHGSAISLKRAKAEGINMQSEFSTIKLAAVGEIPEQELDIMLSMSNEAVLRFSTDVIEYLYNVVHAQLADIDSRKRIRCESAVVQDHIYKHFRASKSDSDGAWTTRYFNTQDAAQAFALGEGSPERNMAEDEKNDGSIDDARDSGENVSHESSPSCIVSL